MLWHIGIIIFGNKCSITANINLITPQYMYVYTIDNGHQII